MGLATGKQAAPVHTGYHAYIDRDGADFVSLAAVDTHTTCQNRRTNGLVGQVFEGHVNGFLAGRDFFFGFVGREVRHNGGMQGIGTILTGSFVAVVQGFVEAIAHPGPNSFFE